MSDRLSYVLRDTSGAYLQGYEGGAYIVGKKRSAKIFEDEAQAQKAARSPFKDWIVERVKP
jgi:hypothetical protein